MLPLDQTDEPRTVKAYRSLCKQFFVTENHEVIPITDIPEEYHQHYSIRLERSEETCTCDDVVKSWSCPFNSCDGQSCTKPHVTPNDFYGLTAKRPLNIIR